MPTFDQGATVKVPFPYTDRSARQRRPALVVSDRAIGGDAGLLWVVMITSAENRPWADDVSLGAELQGAGLSSDSVVRPCKMATVEARFAEPLGRVTGACIREVLIILQRYLKG